MSRNPPHPKKFAIASLLALVGVAVCVAQTAPTTVPATTAPAAGRGRGAGRGGRGGPPASSAFAAKPPIVPMSKTFIDFFLPMPADNLSKDVWGAAQVGPRDPKNGLEDPTVKQWYYWDGQIIKAKDGKYHMFSSRWDQSHGHGGWPQSVAVHSVSETGVSGPYIDKGMTWPDDMGGKGHNVTALVLPGDEGYAVVVSETRPTPAVFESKSLDGPWVNKGTIQGVQNSNISIMVRPDGDFEIVPRNGHVYISKKADGILGPYKDMTSGSIFPVGQQYPNMEDPCVFYAGGYYEVIVNSWSTRKAYHLTSKDGINNWVNRGLAYDPTTDFVKYTDGSVDHWAIMERPGVLVEDGHVTHVTLASINVQKAQDRGNDNNGSKILVLPFDGAKFDAELAKDYATEDAAAATTAPAPK
jgi:hypothetical protein